MAARSKQKESKFQRQSDVTYAKADLLVTDKPDFEKWIKGQTDDLGSAISRVVDDLYRISFKADLYNNCFQVTFTTQDDKHPNANIVLVSRSDDIEEAFWLCVYKTYVKYPDAWPTESDGTAWG